MHPDGASETHLGEVTSERQLYRHRMRAGYRIGDDRTTHLIKCVS